MAINSSIIAQIIQFMANLFVSKEVVASVTLPAPTAVPVIAAPAIEVDWNSPQSKISKRFTVHDATWIPSWHIYHHPTDEQKNNILALASSLEQMYDFVQALNGSCQINVHCWMRPDKVICPGSEWDGKDYNRWIYENQVWKGLSEAEKAAKHVPLSPHRGGHAIDFHLVNFDGATGCAKVRDIMKPHLEQYGLRMENVDGDWIHLDNLAVIHERFFKP